MEKLERTGGKWKGGKRKGGDAPKARAGGPGNRDLLSGLGAPKNLPGPVRARMESALGADFSGVRLYESPLVDRAGAEAAASGDRVAFAPGRLDLSSRSGLELLGHELSHVASQARGEVGGRGLVNDPGLERRADADGARAATASGPALTPLGPGPVPAGGAVQAKKKHKEDEVSFTAPENERKPGEDLYQYFSKLKGAGAPAAAGREDLPAYLSERFTSGMNASLGNASGSISVAGLNAARVGNLLSGPLGGDMSKEDVAALYEKLLSGSRYRELSGARKLGTATPEMEEELSGFSPEDVEGMDASFREGMGQLKGLYGARLKGMRDKYGAYGSQMHPEDFIGKMGPDFEQDSGILQDTLQLLYKSPDLFDLENSEEDREFKTLSDYYNQVHMSLEGYAASDMNVSKGGAFNPTAKDIANYERRIFKGAQGVEGEDQVGGPGFSAKEYKGYLSRLRKRFDKPNLRHRLFGRFKK